jgi:DNA polymerase III subunit gamma/tau
MRAVSYQVFARKYRPRTFDDVLGQDHVVRTLKNAISQNRLAHAYLFVGPRGTGKTSTARIFAKALNCPGGPMVDFNPDDELCIEIEKGIALDVREIDGASNNGVEQVRELREEVKFAPTRCKYKIYYIDEVHMLSTAAFNALLKTLEEPPEHVKFIFATTEAHKVLPTIISRCQRFDLRRIPAVTIAKHLLHIASLEKINLDERAAYAIAKGAEGGMRDAQSMLDQLVAFCGERIEEQDVLDIFGFTRGETVANVALKVLERDTVGALHELHSQSESGKDLSRLLADLIQHFRTLLVHQVDAPAAEEDLSPELTDMVRAQASMADADGLLRVMDGLAEVDARMRWASNKLLHFEIGLIQATQTLGEVTLSEVIAAIGGEPASRETTVAKRAAAPVQTPVSRPAVVASPQPSAPVKPAPSGLGPLRALAMETAPAPAPAPAPKPVVSEENGLKLTPGPVMTTAQALASPEEAWKTVVERVHTERPLISSWLEMASLLGITGNVVNVGLPVTESVAREGLLRVPTKKFLDGVFTELLGKPMEINVTLDSGLKPPAASEMALPMMGLDPAPPVESAPEEDFYNDPLIKSAMEVFKATLA